MVVVRESFLEEVMMPKLSRKGKAGVSQAKEKGRPSRWREQYGRRGGNNENVVRKARKVQWEAGSGKTWKSRIRQGTYML